MAMVCSISFWGGRGPFTPMTYSCNRKGCSIYELQLQQETLQQNLVKWTVRYVLICDSFQQVQFVSLLVFDLSN